MITQERLRRLLHYEPETGVFTWLERSSPHSKGHVGRVAGAFDVRGYWRIKIDYKSYRAARLAWFYMTGEWPTQEIDHINRNPADNRWINLRSVDGSQNTYNRDFGASRGIKRSGRKYSVYIGGKYLGNFDRLEPAVAIRNFALWYGGGSEALQPHGGIS